MTDESMFTSFTVYFLLLSNNIYENVVAQRTYDVRLVGGVTANEGRVEIFFNSAWGTVCDDQFGLEDAQVVCRQLGYSGRSEFHPHAEFGEGTGTIWLDDVNCLGSEAALHDCIHGGWGLENCNHNEDVGVRCQATGIADGTVRLVDGETANEGRVEIYHDGRWGTVCDDSFSTPDGSVVCRQLGFPGLDTIINPVDGFGTIWLDEVGCIGVERTLSSCSASQWGSHNCQHNEDVGVRCNPSLDQEGSLRLVDGASKNDGRLEIFHNRIWGTVCNRDWDRNDAMVACRQLGFPGVSRYGVSSQGVGTIWLEKIACTGTEQSLTDCSHGGWGQHNCQHAEDVAITCNEINDLDGSVRLSGGTSNLEGRVEIFYNGAWGTVCDDMWDYSDAVVVCNQLGFTAAVGAFEGAVFGRGEGIIQLDNVDCSGTEARLADCPHNGWETHNCAHSEDAGVRCSRDAMPDGSLRLVGGTSDIEGRVEIFYSGAWGTVCDDNWGILDAIVICKQLGYSTADSAFSGTQYGPGSGSILLDEVACDGTERRLTDCPHNGWENHNCAHSEDAGVRCSHDIEEGAVRLTDGPSEREGRLEIYYEGQWGTICDDGWSDSESKVVCNQLGFSGGATSFNPHDTGYQEASGMIWLDNVGCGGFESQLTFCSSASWGVNDCSHPEDVGVKCTTKGGLSTGEIVGIVIGSLVGVFLCYCCCCRTTKKKTPDREYAAVPADQSRGDAPQEPGAVPSTNVDQPANNTGNPEDGNMPDLPPPSYNDIGKYSSVIDIPGADQPGLVTYHPPPSVPYPTDLSTPYPPAATHYLPAATPSAPYPSAPTTPSAPYPPESTSGAYVPPSLTIHSVPLPGESTGPLTPPPAYSTTS